jgi:hypothetical protein
MTGNDPYWIQLSYVRRARSELHLVLENGKMLLAWWRGRVTKLSRTPLRSCYREVRTRWIRWSDTCNGQQGEENSRRVAWPVCGLVDDMMETKQPACRAAQHTWPCSQNPRLCFDSRHHTCTHQKPKSLSWWASLIDLVRCKKIIKLIDNRLDFKIFYIYVNLHIDFKLSKNSLI